MQKLLLLVALTLFWGALAAQAAPRFVVQAGHDEAVESLQVAPDGRLLASLSKDSLRVWERGGALRWSVPVQGQVVGALAWNPRGDAVAVGYGGVSGFLSVRGDTAGVQEFRARDGVLLRRLPYGNNTIFRLRYQPNGDLIATSPEGTVRFAPDGTRTPAKDNNEFPAPAGTLVVRAKISADEPNSEGPSAEGPNSEEPGATRQIVDAATGVVRAKIPIGGSLAWSRDGHRLAVFDGQQLWSWSARGARLVKLAAAPAKPDGLRAVLAFAPDGQSVVCARTDFPAQKTDPDSGLPEWGAGRALVWRVDLDSGAASALQSPARRAIYDVAFWPDGALVVGGARYFAGSNWSISELFFARPANARFNAIWSAPQPLFDVDQLATSPDGKWLATAGGDTAIRLWQLGTGRLDKTLKTVSAELMALRFSPDGARVAALDYDRLYLFDTHTGAAKTYAGQGTYNLLGNSIEWSPDGSEVAFATSIETRVLNLKTGAVRAVKSVGRPLRWTGQGWWTNAGNGGLELRDPRSLQVLARLDGSGIGSETPGGSYQQLQAFDFAPQSDALVTLVGQPDPPDGPAQIKLWNVSHNRVDHTITDIGDALSLSVAPNGQSVVVGARSGQVAVYQIEDARQIWTTPTGAPANDVKWSNDGTRVFVGGGDGQTRVLDAKNGWLQATLVMTPARAANKTSYNWLRYAPDGAFDGTPGALAATRIFDADGARLALSDSAPGNAALKRVANAPLSGSGSSSTARAQPPFRVALKSDKPVAPAQSKPSVASGPQLILQGDKIYQFSDLAVSGGGKWLASSQGSGGKIQLWDGKNALQWGTLPAQSGEKPLLFTPDATRLLTSSSNYNPDQDSARFYIKVCAIPSGRVLRKFEIAPLALWCGDAKLRAVVGTKVVDYDVTSGKIMAQRAIQNAPDYRNRFTSGNDPRYAFSRNGAFLVEGSRGTIRWWNAQTGRLLGQFKDQRRAIGRTAIGDDGATLASEGDNPNWSPPTEASSEAAYARQFQLHVWAAQTHKLKRTFPGYQALDGGASLLQFGHGGATLLATGGQNLDRFDIATGKNAPLPPQNTDFKKGLQAPIALSPDALWLGGTGQIYQSSDFGPGLQQWSLAHNKPTANFAGTLRGAAQVKWSPDGKYLAGGDRLTVWDARTGALLAERPGAYTENFEWLDNTTIRSRNSAQIQLWRAPDLAPLPGGFDPRPRGKTRDGENFSDYSDGILIAPDGKTYLTTNVEKFGGRDELWVWDAATQKVARKIKLRFADNRFYLQLDKAIWLDSARIAFGTPTGFQVVNVQTGVFEPEQHDPTDPDFKNGADQNALNPLVASGDGAWLAVGATRDATILIYDARTTKFLRRLPVKAPYVFSAKFLRDNRTLVAPTDQGLEWWNVTAQSERAERVLKNVPSSNWNFSPDERLIGFGADSVSSNGVTICDAQTGQVRARLFLLGGDSQHTSRDWIALTPAGFYAASPAGEQRLRWRENSSFWPLEKSRAQFHRPDLVAAALK